MLSRFKRLGVLAIGLLLLTGLRGAVGQDATGKTPDQPRVRTWTDHSGEHQIEASLVNAQDGKVTLKKKDGTTITVPLDSLSDADREYVKRHTSGNDRASKPIEEEGPTARPEQREPVPPHGRGDKVAEVNFPGGKKSASAALPAAKEVDAEGAGADPDKAEQNAFSQAIEQVVGVLVDSETKVKNDELIRDEVLTHSRGYVEKYTVLKRWQEDGLYHATIHAVVARDKLAVTLRGMKIAMREVAGGQAAHQIGFDVGEEEKAAKMFEKALADFDMTKLVKVEIVGEPEITRDGANASIHIQVKVSPDLSEWKKVSHNLHSVLTENGNQERCSR